MEVHYAVFGHVYGKSANGTAFDVYDSCNGNILSEGYCYSVKGGGQTPGYVPYTCPNSCSNSACISPPSCTDGTFYNTCSKTKPLYCSNGVLVNNCAYCSCSSLSQTCNSDGSCENIPITSNIIINGTSGNDIFQVYKSSIWLNGVSVRILNLSESATLNGLAGDDIFVTVGSGMQIINGGAGIDSFWVDSSDVINDASSEENSQNTVHKIFQYYQPWTTLPSDPNYINLDSNGEKIKDPSGSGTLADYRSTPLFSSSGVHYYDIRQGGVGDCYFMATLATAANEQPQNVRQAVVAIGDGNYIAAFYRSNLPVYLKIDADLYGTTYAKFSNGLWAALIEKSYAYFRRGQNSYASISGGVMSSVYYDVFNRGTSIDADTNSYSDSQLYTVFTGGLNNNKLSTEGSFSSSPLPIVGGHAYANMNSSVNGSQYYQTVYNPWGYDGKTWDSNSNDGLLSLNSSVFKKCFYYLQIST